jgi:rhodanese-related sulfurtransferase
MIPGARAVDLEDLEGALASIPGGREMVVYCAAVKVALLLQRRGIHDIRPLAGGLDAWFKA